MGFAVWLSYLLRFFEGGVSEQGYLFFLFLIMRNEFLTNCERELLRRKRNRRMTNSETEKMAFSQL